MGRAATAHDQDMLLRLDPAHPPLWRDAATLQFGLEPVAIVEASEPWHERLVRELEHGVPPAALEAVGAAIGAPAGAASAYVGRLSRALAKTRPASARAVALQRTDGVGSALMGDVVTALEAAGLEVREHAGEGDAVVMVAHHVVNPRSAALLVGRDIPHLPVVFGGRAVEIGPFVRPGTTPCLACIAAHRRDADETWPHVAAQLVGRRSPAVPRALAWEAGLAAVRMVTDAERHPSRQTAHSLTIHAETGSRTTRTHRPHAACRCRSLGGSAMAPVRGVPATRTATAYAQPA